MTAQGVFQIPRRLVTVTRIGGERGFHHLREIRRKIGPGVAETLDAPFHVRPFDRQAIRPRQREHARDQVVEQDAERVDVRNR